MYMQRMRFMWFMAICFCVLAILFFYSGAWRFAEGFTSRTNGGTVHVSRSACTVILDNCSVYLNGVNEDRAEAMGIY